MKTFRQFIETLQESSNEGPSDLVKKIAKTFKGSEIDRNQSLYANVKYLDENHSTIIFFKNDRPPFQWICYIIIDIIYPGSKFKVEGKGRTATEAFEDAKGKLKGAYAVEKSAWDNHARRMKHGNDKDYDEFVDEMNTAANTVNTLLKIK